MRLATTAAYAGLPSEALRCRLLRHSVHWKCPASLTRLVDRSWTPVRRNRQAVRARKLFGFSLTRNGLRSPAGRGVGRTVGPGCGCMTVDQRHARRLGLQRNSLRRLRCDGFPQLSQEGWGRLNRRYSFKKG